MDILRIRNRRIIRSKRCNEDGNDHSQSHYQSRRPQGKGCSPKNPDTKTQVTGTHTIHHNLPLDDGGTNDFANLVLIKNDPYHKAVTNEQNSQTRGLVPKQSKTINWPMFEDDIYPSKPFKRRE